MLLGVVSEKVDDLPSAFLCVVVVVVGGGGGGDAAAADDENGAVSGGSVSINSNEDNKSLFSTVHSSFM